MCTDTPAEGGCRTLFGPLVVALESDRTNYCERMIDADCDLTREKAHENTRLLTKSRRGGSSWVLSSDTPRANVAPVERPPTTWS
jgi:hypothetical protein